MTAVSYVCADPYICVVSYTSAVSYICTDPYTSAVSRSQAIPFATRRSMF